MIRLYSHIVDLFNIHVMYYINYIFKSTLKAKFSCKEYSLIKVYNKYSCYSSLIIIDNIVLQFP